MDPTPLTPKPGWKSPLSTLARRLPEDILDEFRDDLSTVRGMDLTAAGGSATATVDDAFTYTDAARVVTIALDLARRF